MNSLSINNSFYHQAVSHLEERAQIFISNQDKKILLIAAAALALLVACYFACIYCFKTEQLNDSEKRVTSDGTIEEGKYQNGQLHGPGKRTRDSGQTIIEGDFYEGVLEGRGKITFTAGSLLYCEQGLMVRARDNGVWEGEFLEGQMHKGKMILSDGKVLEGEFRWGTLWKGEITFVSGEVWEGEFDDSFFGGLRLHGEGKKKDRLGKVVEEGNFVNGLLHGEGKKVTSTGEIHEGRFHAGKLYGQGQKTMPNGEIFKGIFSESDAGDFRGKKKDAQGNIWEGVFLNGHLRGQGSVSYASGMIFEGEFDIGQLRKGKVTFPNGRMVEGSFGHHFDAHGIRKYVSQQGILYEEEEIAGGPPGGPTGSRIKKTLTSGETREGYLIDRVIHVDKVTHPDGREEMKNFQEALFA